MSRRDDSTPYAEMGAGKVFAGLDVSQPTAGFFRFKLVSGGVAGGVRIWFGPPLDPVTGEELDRSHRWQAMFDGEPLDFDRCWPQCAGSPVSEAEYTRYVMRRVWAREHAQGSAYAERHRKVDPLSRSTPLPF